MEAYQVKENEEKIDRKKNVFLLELMIFQKLVVCSSTKKNIKNLD